MKTTIYWVMLSSCIVLTACSKNSPLLENNKDYIGEWKNESSTLNIAQDGKVKFAEHIKSERKNASSDMKSSTISNINAPLTEFNTQYFQIGQGDLSKQFKINKAPFQQDGQWRVVLNGEVYMRN
ncbi:hypothetical protein [Acinetobacter sp. CFCC 10889]|uniref:hypothetical protein n=1 Tax=Acinetobacter sp. CFCC 10889 TaxID=1775557 RepID=UPI000DD014B4|nr:hypothetical protein [Acinetobacter sp. CFCC 10889]